MRKEYVNRIDAELINPAVTYAEYEASRITLKLYKIIGHGGFNPMAVVKATSPEGAIERFRSLSGDQSKVMAIETH